MKKKATLTQAQIKKLTADVCKEATDKAMLLFLAALHDEYGFGEKRLVRVIERAGRYGEHIDQHLVGLREVQKIIEESTGLRFRGW
jgi:hypothetical protein